MKKKKDAPDCRISASFPGQKLEFVSQSGNHALWTYQGRDGNRRAVAINCQSGYTDYPIKYDNGSVGWDRPEAFPLTFRRRAAKKISRFPG